MLHPRPLAVRRPLTLFAASLALVGLGACGESRAAEQPQRPNVILIVVDTLRADMLLRQDLVKTPNLEALAKDGVVFPKAFSHAPMTLPSHTSLFSSRLPFETGVLVNGVPLPSDLPLFPERLSASGYRTTAAVSLGTLVGRPGKSLNRAFEAYTGVEGVTQAPTTYARIEQQLDDLQADQPFFLFAHFSDPHEPYNAHGTVDHKAEILIDDVVVDVVSTSDMTYWDREVELAPGEHVVTVRSEDPFKLRTFQCEGKDLELEWESESMHDKMLEGHAVIRNVSSEPRQGTIRLWVNDGLSKREIQRRYRLEVEFADRYVGELLDALRARGLYDSSVIAFTSDHGEALGDHGMFAHVQSLYDELIHVPLILKPAAGDDRRDDLMEIRDELFTHLDLAPTLLDLAGVPAMPTQRGHSVLGPRPEARVHIAQTHKPESKRNLVCARDERFKMILDADQDTFEMYDLARDPGELENVFDALRHERPDWPDLLRGIARAAAGAGDVEIDEETRAALRAMGYAGEGE